MSNDVITVISSDGHAGALMADYRPYLDPRYREEFDAFLIEWNEKGTRNFDPPALKLRVDPKVAEEWNQKMVEPGRLQAFPDPHRRLKEMEREGVSAEVIFPDFGLPFELYSPSYAASIGYPPMDEEHRYVARQAFNRWMVDFVSVAPERFIPMAAISWLPDDVDTSVADIRWAREAGFKGIVLPEFDPKWPLYHPNFDPIWNVLEELEMIVNSHSATSSTTNRVLHAPAIPHPACAIRLFVPEVMFYCHMIFDHLIWGGVLDKHPKIKVVLTEQGSAWMISTLKDMDYAYEGSYFRTDIREVITRRPSEYFERQVYLGSSIFSRAEVAARHEIGVHKMMLGMDIPHQEGTLMESTQDYLQATLGAEAVPLDEALKMVGGTAAEVFEVDLKALVPTANRVGLRPRDILTPPERDLFPLGDVNKPLSMR